MWKKKLERNQKKTAGQDQQAEKEGQFYVQGQWWSGSAPIHLVEENVLCREAPEADGVGLLREDVVEVPKKANEPR